MGALMVSVGLLVGLFLVGIEAETLIGSFSTLQHSLAGEVSAINEGLLVVRNFRYDGAGPAAYFWGDTTSETPTRQGFRLLDANGSCGISKLAAGNGMDTPYVEMPAGVKVSDLRSISVWCEDFDANFGDVVVSVGSLDPATGLVCSEGTAVRNCEPLSERFQVTWSLQDADMIEITLTARIGAEEYMGFGISGLPNRTTMVGSDVAIAYAFPNGSFSVEDFYMSSREQCSQGLGVCPDRVSNAFGSPGRSNVELVSGKMENGVVSIVFKRPVVGVDAGSYDGDYAVEAGKATFITWALGPVDSGTGYPLFHNIEYPRTDVSIEFGRSPVDHCQESLVSTEESVNGISRPYISGNTTLVARIGPSGGKRGYQAITGRPGWGIAWYMNDILIPVIGLERGTTYTFVTQGGGDEQHPFYITSSSEGGFSQETPAGRLNQTVYAGIGDVVGNSSGIFNWTLLGDGALCEYTGVSEIPANITDFREYLTLLNTSCSTDRDIQSMSKSFEWTPDTSTPDIVYYQCTQHRLLGWKMRVFDAGATNESELVALSDALLMTTLNASGTPAPGGVCFPALARVELDTGATIPMERLKIGDRVRTTSSSFSEVFFFGHRDLEAVHQFLSIETESETGPRTLEMSASHLVFISTASSPKAVAARTLLPGVELISSHGTLERVKSVKTVFRRGLLNPHTLDGRIVVNGFQASCFNSFAPPRWGHALLLLERWAYSLGRSILGDIFFINRPKPFDVLLTPWLRS